MKKLAIILAVALFIGMMLSACHGQKNCPAYSKAEEISVEANV